MADGRKVVRLEGWEEFYEIYWTVLVEWLEKKGISSHNAEDLVQGFIEKLWKSGKFASSLDPEGGKLRSFLLKSLQNWYRDQLARDNCIKRGGGQEPLEYDEGYGSEADSEQHYDRAWARTTLTHACRTLRAEYQERGNQQLFDRGLALLDDRDPEEFDHACEQLGMKRNTLNVAIKRLRERLSARIRREVEATLTEPTPAQVNEEIRHLLAAFEDFESFSEIVSSLSLGP